MKKITLFIVIALIAIGCKHQLVNPTITDPIIDPPPPPAGTPAICFETEILPLLRSSCAQAGCHDAATHQEDYVLDSYANIIKKGITPGRAGNSKLYKVLIDNDINDRMPKAPNAPLTSVQIAAIAQWINEGAKNTTGCGSVCIPTAASYQANILPLLKTNCVGCHSAGNATGVDLSSFAGVRTVALNGKLLGSVNWQMGYSAMPKNGTKLPACNIQQIQNWITNGANNN
jgi:hypothetical protein